MNNSDAQVLGTLEGTTALVTGPSRSLGEPWR
jgi:hypothetical protein